MAEALRNTRTEDEKLAQEKLALVPEGTAPLPPALPGTPPAFDEAQGRRMRDTERASAVGEKIGETLGSAVEKVRTGVRSGLRIVGGRAKDASAAASDMADQARVKASQWSEVAAERMSDVGRTAQESLDLARRRVRHYSQEYPLQTLGVIAGVAFVVGFALRVWRSNSE